MKRNLWINAIFAIVMLSGCTPVNEAAQEKMRQTQILAKEGQAQVGMPGIVNFTELRIFKELYELRDVLISTYTYIVTMDGSLWHLCNSLGYGLPFSSQFSNPEGPVGLKTRPKQQEATIYVLPQPEPNGLYPPTSSSATWILCIDSNGLKEYEPIYGEPELLVSPFPLRAVGSYVLEDPPDWR